MGYRRIRVSLEEDQWIRLKTLAQELSQKRGRRVSASEVLRELLDKGLREVSRSEALRRLSSLRGRISLEGLSLEGLLEEVREGRVQDLLGG
ncbi:hypothetical protein YIM1640_07200 [Thermus oshimai]|jgi:Arc/MetJ-type ribon-helix-helix transcriptional regulator